MYKYNILNVTLGVKFQNIDKAKNRSNELLRHYFVSLQLDADLPFSECFPIQFIKPGVFRNIRYSVSACSKTIFRSYLAQRFNESSSFIFHTLRFFGNLKSMLDQKKYHGAQINNTFKKLCHFIRYWPRSNAINSRHESNSSRRKSNLRAFRMRQGRGTSNAQRATLF